MKTYVSILLLFAVSLIALPLHAQTDTVINGKHYTAVDPAKTVKKKKYPSLDSTFVLNNKKFRYYNNWLTLGAGVQQNLSYKRTLGFAGGLDYNFHIKDQYFNAGTVITGERFGFYNNYQFHVGYGRRYEDNDFHTSAFAGISYSTGYGKVDSVYSRPYQQVGLYIQGELVKKIAYDVGIGVSLFGDFNAEQSIVGARLVLYFSGAYRGIFNDQFRGNANDRKKKK